MASTDYLNDLRFCPDCGQPTSSSFRTWGNTICHSTSPKLKCKPLKAHNFCGRCGAADPGDDCAGCRSPEYQWTQLSENERWFWTHFTLGETPLIAVSCLIVGGGLIWFQVHVLQARLVDYYFIWMPIQAAGITMYGLIRAIFRLGWAPFDGSTPNSTDVSAAGPKVGQALPIARVVRMNTPRLPLVPCPDCGHSVSKRAIRCPQCGCELQSR